MSQAFHKCLLETHQLQRLFISRTHDTCSHSANPSWCSLPALGHRWGVAENATRRSSFIA
ncbi:hypothetical protein E2C01_091260 [Portunus trituberculatus]|uniref:Uncharacterized protein n=1 Tax=Portunus trituberculatus TaxID=210409 RepID=A0A5B7JUJ3_PORTR|nr:hypothetical protein [Portunus trituberculatus]